MTSPLGERLFKGNLSHKGSRWENESFYPLTALPSNARTSLGTCGKWGAGAACSAQCQPGCDCPVWRGCKAHKILKLGPISRVLMHQTAPSPPEQHSKGSAPPKNSQTNPCPDCAWHRPTRQLPTAPSSFWWQNKSWCLLGLFNCT